MKTTESAKLAKNVLIIGISKVLAAAVSFALLPIMTKMLGANDYGVLDLIISYAALLAPVALLGLDVGVFRFLIEARGDDSEKTRIVSTAIGAVLPAVIVGTCLFMVANMLLHLHISVLALWYVLVMAAYAFAQQVSRGVGDNKTFAISSVLYSLISAAGSILLLMVFGFGLDGVLLAYILAATVATCVCLLRTHMHKHIRPKRYDRELRKSLLRYSLPMIPDGISWWIFHTSDRTVLALILGVAASGIYAVSNKFSNILGVVDGILYASWVESAAKNIKSPRRKKFFSTIFNTQFKLFGTLCILSLPCVSIVYPILIDAAFAEGYLFFPFLALSCLFNFVMGYYSAIYLAKKLTVKVMKSSIIGAVINLAVNLALIWIVGIWAAAISTVVAYGIIALYRHYDMKKYIKISYERGIFVKIFGLFAVFSVVYYINNFWMSASGMVAAMVCGICLNRKLITKVLSSSRSWISKQQKTSRKNRKLSVGFVMRMVLGSTIATVGVAIVVVIGVAEMVPGKYFWTSAGVWGVFSALVGYGVFRSDKKRMVRTACAWIGAAIIAVVAVFAIRWTVKLNSLFDNIQEPETSEVAETQKGPVSETFVLYISGIDVLSHDLPDNARSDVNILVIVNPAEHKILTVTTPRDFYVEMPSFGYAKEKLTNVGVYGVGESIKVLSNLYGIGIDYYARVNFDTLIGVIDTIGGIEVESDYDFYIEGHHFTKGTNYLDGARALAFSRERKSFAEGDRVRGRHQQVVLEAIFQKMMGADMLANAGAILDTLADSFVTNFGADNIRTFIRNQLDTMASWEVQNIEVNGYGDSQVTYSSGSQYAYVMQPDWGTVEAARAKIAEVMAVAE